jgi:hypothetical protein
LKKLDINWKEAMNKHQKVYNLYDVPKWRPLSIKPLSDRMTTAGLFPLANFWSEWSSHEWKTQKHKFSAGKIVFGSYSLTLWWGRWSKDFKTKTVYIWNEDEKNSDWRT